MELFKLVKRHYSWIVVGLLALFMLGWAFLHPELQLEASAVPSAVRAEFAKMGFSGVRGVDFARFTKTESMFGVSENIEFEQKIAGLDRLLTEKRTKVYARRSVEEDIGLYVG